jgi:hypothetical protein
MFLRLEDYDLLDAAGRSYARSRRGWSRLPAPGFTVYQDGRRIGSGQFEYG